MTGWKEMDRRQFAFYDELYYMVSMFSRMIPMDTLELVGLTILESLDHLQIRYKCLIVMILLS
jgi:hypothetical protein